MSFFKSDKLKLKRGLDSEFKSFWKDRTSSVSYTFSFSVCLCSLAVPLYLNVKDILQSSCHYVLVQI